MRWLLTPVLIVASFLLLDYATSLGKPIARLVPAPSYVTDPR